MDCGLFCPGYCLKLSKFCLVLGRDLSGGFVVCLFFLGDGDLDLGCVGEDDLDWAKERVDILVMTGFCTIVKRSLAV